MALFDTGNRSTDVAYNQQHVLVDDGSGNPTKVKPDQITGILPDTTALAAYTGTRTIINLIDGRIYKKITSSATSDGVGYVSVSGDASSRWYLQNEYIDVRWFGVTYGSGVSAGVRTTNTSSLQAALNSNRIVTIIDIIEVSGTITITNKNINLSGIGQYAAIRQMTDANLLVINQTSTTTLVQTDIHDIVFEAGGVFTTGVAITHNGYSTQDSPDTIYQKPFANINNILIKGQNNYIGAATSWTHEWKKAIVFSVPNRITFKDSTIQGASGINNTTNTIGIELTTTRAAVESIFENIQVINVQTGLKYTQSTVSPAIEGLHIVNCSFISNWRSVDILGSSLYGAPGWFFTGCHFASLEVCLNLNNVRQGFIHNCLFYNYGNSTSGQTASFLQMVNCSDFQIDNNKFLYQGGSGPTNKPYGILIAGSSGNEAVANIISHNYFALHPGDTKPAIWLQAFAVNNKIFNNYRFGGNASVVTNLPYNTVINNTPYDALDGAVTAILAGSGTDPGAILTRVNAGDVTQGYVLDISNSRSELVIIPSGVVESNSYIKTITMNSGQNATLYFNGTVKVQHSSSLYLENNISETFFSGEKLNITNPNFGIIEVSRSTNFSNYNFVDVATTTTPTIDPSRGFVYSIYNNTTNTMTVTVDVTKMKLGQSIIIKRYSDASTGPIIIAPNNSSQIQIGNGGFASSFTFPVAEGGRGITWMLNSGGLLEMTSGFNVVEDGSDGKLTTSLSAVGTTTYYLLGTTPTTGNSAALDMTRIIANVGTWAGGIQQDIDLSFVNRTTFTYTWSSRGQQQATNGCGLFVYRNADTTASIYMVLSGVTTRGITRLLLQNQLSGWPTSLTGTTTAPTGGTVVFDSRDPITYPYSPVLGVTAPTIISAANGATTFTLTAAHWGCHLDFVNSAACTVNITGTIPKGFTCSWAQSNTGQLTFVGSGVTLRLIGGTNNKSGGVNSTGSMIARADNDITMAGYLIA